MIRLLLIFLTISLLQNLCIAQEHSQNSPLQVGGQMPEYPGGDIALLKHISNSLVYPKDALKKNVTGTVYVSYIVDKDGSIKDVKVAKGSNEYLDDEAIRVVQTLEKYQPGMQDGEPVPVQFTVPVRFAL